MHTILSRKGGDRATGYTMNNKIVTLDEGLVCTWLDSGRQNCWALVDPGSGEIVKLGTIGAPGLDNHCGAALVKSGESVHALIGGHHGPLEHYRLDRSTWTWSKSGVAGEAATYPSATADTDGDLHVFYRCGGKKHWSLNYVRTKDGEWQSPIQLIHAHKPGYVYWTNGVTTAADETMHLVFGNPKVLNDGAIHYGASHVASKDGGVSWQDDDGRSFDSEIQAETLPFLPEAGSADRVQSLAEQRAFEAPGPENYNYQNMNLSNPVSDSTGTLHVVLHNNMTGGVTLCSLTDGRWSSRPLLDEDVAGERVHPQSSLSIGSEDVPRVALMIEPTDRCVWGPDGTHLKEVVVDSDTRVADVVAADPELAQWLPAYGHPQAGEVAGAPAMLYTVGRNAGGFGNNQNALETEVRLVLGNAVCC